MGLVKDFATSLGTRAITVVVGLATSIFVARSLQPDGKGAYALLFTTVQLAAAMGVLGLGKAVVYYLGKNHREKLEVMDRRSVTSNVVGVGLVLGVCAGAATGVICYGK